MIPGFSIRDFRQPPLLRLARHEHTHASVCFVARGSYVEHVRGRAQECPPRSMMFKPAAEPHADVFGCSGARCVLIEVRAGRLETAEPFTELVAKPGVARSARLSALGGRLCGELANWDSASPLALEGLILEVLAEASRSIRDERVGPRGPRWLRQARELIHDHAHEPLSLAHIARAAAIHPSHLARTFRKYYGRPIGDYVRALRIERAAGALAGTDAPLSEIALRFGFFDQSHFCKVFKQQMGLTPAQFRALSS